MPIGTGTKTATCEKMHRVFKSTLVFNLPGWEKQSLDSTIYFLYLNSYKTFSCLYCLYCIFGTSSKIQNEKKNYFLGEGGREGKMLFLDFIIIFISTSTIMNYKCKNLFRICWHDWHTFFLYPSVPSCYLDFLT